MINKFLEIALGEVGYLEKKSNSNLDDKTANAGSNNYTKYGAWYANGSLQAQPWCAMFVSWCAYQAGISNDIFYSHAYCPYGVSWYKDRGQWHDRSGYTPKKGDIIYFQSGGVAAHVGLVYDVDKSKVYTVEGNTSGGSTLVANGGGVAKKLYSLSYASIMGYATPAYQNEPDIQSKNIVGDRFIELMNTYRKNLRDNDSGVWSKEARKWVVEQGLFIGSGTVSSGEPNYMWEDLMTREQAAQLFYRFAMLMERR